MHRCPAIETGRHLEPDPWSTTPYAADEAGVEHFRRVAHQPDIGRNAGFLQALQAAACHAGEGIFHGRNDSGNAGIDQRFRTGRCLAVMGAGFQRHVSGRAASTVTGFFEGVNFRMRFTGLLVPPFANDFAIAHDDAADHRVRVGAVSTSCRELQRTGHVRTVGRAEHLQVFFLPRSSGSSDICSRLAAASEMRWRRLISSSNSVMSWKRR